MTAGSADRAAARTRLSPRVIVVVLAGLIVLLTAAIAAEAVLGHQHQDDRIGLVLTLTLWSIAAVGLVVAFAARLTGAVALPEVRADLVAVVGQALEPAHLAVWLADGAR